MKHISDHILEVYALNRHALRIEDQLEVYRHIESCSECRQVLSHLCQIWKKDILLVFEPISDLNVLPNEVEPINDHTTSEQNKNLIQLGNYVSSSSQKILKLTKSISNSNCFINLQSYIGSSNSLFLTKLSFSSDWTILKNHEPDHVTFINDSVPQDLLSSSAIIKVSQDFVIPSDEYMISKYQHSIIIDTHRPELNTAIFENPGVSFTKFDSLTGVFEIPEAVWTSKSRIYLFSV